MPPTRFVVRPQQEYGLGTGTTPKETRAFQAQIDHASHGTFNGPTPNRQLERHELSIRHAVLVLDEILTMLADRLAVAASAEVTYRRNDLCHLAPHQQVALLRAPAGTRLGTPVFAQCCDLAQVVHRVIEVQQLMHLCGS